MGGKGFIRRGLFVKGRRKNQKVGSDGTVKMEADI